VAYSFELLPVSQPIPSDLCFIRVNPWLELVFLRVFRFIIICDFLVRADSSVTVEGDEYPAITCDSVEQVLKRLVFFWLRGATESKSISSASLPFLHGAA
jgi:hypothetical protein